MLRISYLFAVILPVVLVLRLLPDPSTFRASISPRMVHGFAPTTIGRRVSSSASSRNVPTTTNSIYQARSTTLNTAASSDLLLSQLLPQLPQLPAPPSVSIDPTTVLSDIFRTVLGTPLILAIPIVAALLVATLIAYLIVAYANPAEEEE